MAAEDLGSKDKPLVSVITPVFSQSEYSEDAIRSVQEQEYPKVEHIIVDGRSTDGTVKILKAHGDRIRWISEPDNGQMEALDKGFRMARGQILGWLNADDLYKPNTVQVATKFLTEHPNVATAHGAGQYIGQASEVILTREGGYSGLEKLLAVNTVMSVSAFFRRQVLDRVGYLDESLHYAMDWRSL